MTTLNADKLFVSKIIQEKDIAPAVDVPSYFITDPDYVAGYKYITQYYSEHGSVPTLRVMRADCPKAEIIQVDEPWEDVIKRVQYKYLKGIMNTELDKVVASYQDDNMTEAINFLGTLVSKVHTAIPNKRDVDATQTGQERLARYIERRDNPGTLVGIPTGYPTIDKATQGLQPGQLITLTGLTKASKSALALTVAMAAQEYGKRVLYLTYEMTCDEQTNRLDAYRAGFNDRKLNNGDLSPEDMAKLTEGIHRTEALPSLVFAEDVMTVTAIGAKCDQVEPDIVIVDGAYMLDDEQGEPTGSPNALTHIVSSLKSMAMNRKICIIVVTQSTPARTKGESLNNDSIAGSRSFGHYSNVVIGIERTKDTNIRKIKIIMSRSCAPCEILAEFDFDTGTFKELEGYELDADIEELLDDGTFEDNF